MSNLAGVSAALIGGIADSLTLSRRLGPFLNAAQNALRREKVTFLPQFADNSQAAGFQSLDIMACFV
jgi:hypothetical protein